MLDHNPTEEDLVRFFRRFQEALTARGLTLKGVTTDGSPLYPPAIAEVFGPVPRSNRSVAKLARLRRRVARFKGLRQTLKKRFSPNLEKALTFLDDSLLPATSNAVERGNRRHRKMQKTIYRVRTAPHLSQRIAVDMLRDAQAEGRFQTTQTLHLARAG